VSATPQDQSAATSGAADVAFVSRPAVAVLPFDNMSRDEEQGYFVDGVAEYLGTVAAENPAELLHKIRHGNPGDVMPAYLVLAWISSPTSPPTRKLCQPNKLCQRKVKRCFSGKANI